MQKILSIEPAQFDFFTRIFTKISDNSSFEPICIKNSKLVRRLDSSIISVDFSELFGSDSINLNILDHKKASKIFRSIKTDNKINILEDVDRYYIAYIYSGPKKDYAFTFTVMKSEENKETYTLPQVDDNTLIDRVTIDKEIFDTVRKMSKVLQTNEINFLLKDNKLQSISVSDEATMTIGDQNVTIDNADIILKSTSFLIFDAEDIEIDIHKLNDTYMGIYKIELGFPVNFTIYETLVNTEDEIELI